ncbi:MAG: tetratricopeptide repeat protein [Muribaculaceae bacterium]|nr:tetratricopeptide repeat protein [Muribaculaceae bacterium]
MLHPTKIILLPLLLLPLFAFGSRSRACSEASPASATDSVAFNSTAYLALVDSADAAGAASQWGKAIGFLRSAMRLEPANPSNILLLTNVGMMQFYQGQDDEAIATLTDAVAFDSLNTDVLMRRARVLNSLGRLPEALRDYQAVIDIDSTAVGAIVQRAFIYLNTNRLELAEADLSHALSLAPDDPEATLGRAIILSSSGHPDEAIPLYSRLIALEPSPELYAARATCYLVLENLGRASSDIMDGLALDPDYGELYLCRSALNKLRYSNDDALADARRAAALGIDPRRIYALTGIKP